MRKLLVCALIAAPLSSAAAVGELCLSNLAQGEASEGNALTNTTRYECLTAGEDITIPELYKKGWRVTAVLPQKIPDPSIGLQRDRWTLLIEKIKLLTRVFVRQQKNPAHQAQR